MARSVKDRTAEKYGRLQPREYFFKENEKGKNIVFWKCDCDCGNKDIIVRGTDLGNGTNSCGCKRVDINRNIAKNNITHGMSSTKFYKLWRSMIDRCTNERHECYSAYGGRGIEVCDEWLIFQNFYDDMYKGYLEHIESHGKKDTSIDRVDVNKGYSKSNCKWETWHNQYRNRRGNKYFVAKNPKYGSEICKVRADFAVKYNLDASCISKCLKKERESHKGWTFRYATDKEILEILE